MDKQIPEKIVSYLLYALGAMPQTYTVLLRGVSAAELDAHPDPERFTLREAIAHVADWEGVWLDRMKKIATEDSPFLLSYDEGQWAIDHDYAHSDFDAQMVKITAGRQAMVAYLRGLEMSAWSRVGQHGDLGPIRLFDLVVLVAGHDGYHAQQILDYRGLNGTTTA